MATYYVSNAGNDADDGLEPATAWKTLAKASAVTYRPGDHLKLDSSSQWTEPLRLRGSGSPEAPVIVSGHGAGRPRLLWGQGAAVELRDGNHWVIRGLEVVLTSPNTLYPALRGVDDPAQVGQAPRRTREGVNTGILAVFEGDEAYEDLRIEGNVIYGAGVDQSSEGILVIAALPPKASQPKLRRLVLRNNLVEQVGWRGIGTEGPHRAFDPENIPWMAFEDVLLEGNTARGLGVQGICVFNAHQVVMRRNLVDGAGKYHGVGVTWGPAGLWPWSCADVLIEFNEVTGMFDSNSGADATGIDIDWSSHHVTVRHNHCYGNLGNGIVTMACLDCRIEHNRVEGNLCRTNLGPGQIALCDFQNETVDNAITGITNLEIQDNLIILDRDSTCALSAKKISPGKEWENISFTHNRLVFFDHARGTFGYDLALQNPLARSEGNLFYGTGPEEFKANLPGGEQNWPAWRQSGNDAGARWMSLDTTAPAPVADLEGVLEGGRVRLQWEPSQDSRSGIHHYNIFRGAEPGFLPRYLNLVGTSSEPFFTDPELLAPGEYWYKVEAEDGCGNTSGLLAVLCIAVSA